VAVMGFRTSVSTWFRHWRVIQGRLTTPKLCKCTTLWNMTMENIVREQKSLI